MTDSEPQQNPKQNKTTAEHPGQALAEARRNRGISVLEAARELKLPRTTLTDLEAGRLDRIAPIYRRGYIVNYARLVGLDPEPLLEGLDDDEPEPLRPVLPASRPAGRFDRFVKFATYALVTTMIVPPLVYFFVSGGARLFESEVAGPDSTGGVVAEGSGERSGYRERIIEALAMRSAGSGEDTESHLSASALPMSTIRPSDEQAASETPVAPETEPSDAPAGDGMTRLELSLDDDSWVEIEAADGERMEFDLLRAGTTREYRGQPPFKLLLGRASAVDLVLDGQPVAFDGHDRNGVVELVLQPPVTSRPESGGSSQPAE